MINNDGAIIENTNSKNNEDINGDCINSKEKNNYPKKYLI